MKLLEDVLQAKLQDAPRDRTRGDLSKGSRVEAVAGFIVLCVIEQVVEFGAELKAGVFPQPSTFRILDDGRVEVDLRTAAHDSDRGVAEARAALHERGVRSRAA